MIAFRLVMSANQHQLHRTWASIAFVVHCSIMAIVQIDSAIDTHAAEHNVNRLVIKEIEMQEKEYFHLTRYRKNRFSIAMKAKQEGRHIHHEKINNHWILKIEYQRARNGAYFKPLALAA